MVMFTFEFNTWISSNIMLTFGIIVMSSILTLSEAGFNKDKPKVSFFDVKPGGMVQDYSQTKADVTCTFTYAAQGGTKEEWTMTISHASSAKWECTVERPGGVSYLFFQNFKLEFDGAKVISAHAEGEQGQALKPEEFEVDKKSKFVSHVDGKFESHLSKVVLYAKKRKQEL